ncbi:MAG: ExbD/TolR family protein [bacterium]
MSRRIKTEVRMDLTSLIDVIFLLLIFFMLSTTFSKIITKLDIKLPKARSVTPYQDISSKSENVIIEVSENHRLSLNGEEVTLSVLDGKLAEIARKNPLQVIVIRGDKEVDYGMVIKIMGACKSYNLEKIALAALQEY